MPKTEISSGIYTEEKTAPKVRFSLKVKALEVRIFEGNDFCFESSQILEKEIKETIARGMGRSPQNSMISSDSKVSEIQDTETELQFAAVEDYFYRETTTEDNYRSSIDENKGRIRIKKRLTERYFQLFVKKLEFSYLDLENSIEKIDSQIGFTIENLLINEIRSNNKRIQIFWFDNDLSNYKNIGLKIITLENNPNTATKNEKSIEFYLKSEFIQINLNHQSVAFAYLIAQPILLFMQTELTKDEKMIKKANNPDMLKSIVMDRIEEDQDDDISASVWKISDTKLEDKTKIYVKYLHIQYCKIKVNYKSDTLNIVNLYKGELGNYITNLVDIKELRIKIKDFKIKEKMLLQQAISVMIKFYLDDLIYKQNLNLLASVYPIRVTINIMKAFASLVRAPVNSYLNEQYLFIGIYQGFSTFLSEITHEFSDVGSKLMGYLNSWKRLVIE